MKWTQNFLSMGILFIILGVLLLVISSGGFENSVFFIFPFFFFSASEPVSTFLILGFIIFIFVIMIRTTSAFFGQSNTQLSVGSECKICLKPLPVNAAFCPSCGNPADYETMSNQ